MIIPKNCRSASCGAINMNGDLYCPKHDFSKQKKKKRVYEERNKLYNTQAWRLLSKNMRSSNPFCMCGEVVDVVDHIIEIKDGGDELNEDNLQTLCHECHNRKTIDVADARKNNRLDEFYKEYIKFIKKTKINGE